VYEAEPRVPAALVALENVVLLPHLGSATEEARLAMWRLAWRNLLAGVRGEPLPNPVEWRAHH
jgi:lactate dehydrogenase-like 2-hydroxyacid dehydrogenase